MQTDRLFQMIYLLMNRKTIPARELAQRFEVSVRTVYRDLDVLSAAGIPVYAARGKGGGIRMLDNFVLDRSILSDDEQNQLLSALQNLVAVQIQGSAEALQKLQLLFQKQETDWLRIDFSEWGASETSFHIIRQAIQQHRRLTFEYHAASTGQKTHRLVEPQTLWFKARTWYLIAYDPFKKSSRTFKLCRMKQVEITGEPFVPDCRELPQEPVQDSRPNVELHLKIDACLSYRVYDDFPEELVRREKDGFYVTVSYPEDEWVYGYLLSFGEHLEVLAPLRIRNLLHERVLRMLEKTAPAAPEEETT